MITRDPALPVDGDKPVMDGIKLNTGPAVEIPFITTCTVPVVAALGTETTMLVLLQLDTSAGTPLNTT